MEGINRRQRVDRGRRDVSMQASSSKAKKPVISSGRTGKTPGTNTMLPQENRTVSIEVSSSLMRLIKGRGGSPQKKIEDDFGVKIILSSSRNEDRIRIEGKSREAVSRALEKMQIIIKEAVESPNLDYSHFVSLPLAIHKELVDKLFKFQNSILGDDSSKGDHSEVKDGGQQGVINKGKTLIANYPPKASKSSSLSNLGIDKSIFTNPRTFHLTVLMLKLWNKDRASEAREVLKSISSDIKEALENRPVFIRLKGLECMQASFAKARVIYAPVVEIGNQGRLLRACQVITDAFNKAGLVVERDRERTLKLHATLMNAKFSKNKNVDSIDARGIFEEYGTMDWGKYNIRKAHLSQRFSYDKDGYFHCCASIPFPEPVQTKGKGVETSTMMEKQTREKHKNEGTRISSRPFCC